MRGAHFSLLAGATGLLLAWGPGNATQPVERPDPPPAPGALVACDTDTGPTAYLPRLLRVVVNGASMRDERVFLQRPCGALLAREQDLNDFRIRTAGKPSVQIDGEPYLNLNRYDDLRYELDPARQALSIEGEPHIFFPTVLDFGTPPPQRSQVSPGAFLNYGILGLGPLSGDGQTLSANAGLGIFGRQGVLTSDWLATHSETAQSVHRIGTTYTRDDLARIATFRAGDLRSRGGAYGNGVALAGLQYATNFATRPRMQVAPVEMMEAATRRNAILDLVTSRSLDDEDLQRSGFLSNLSSVPYGPVELVNMPTYNNGQFELTLRDALGVQAQVRQPFFFNNGLLRPGLSDFSFEAGWLRTDVQRDEYGKAFGAATWRHGLSQTLTVEGHGEAGTLGVALGASGSKGIPYVGVITATLAGSDHEAAAHAGAYGAVSLENRFERIAWSARLDCQDREFLLPSVTVQPLFTNICRSFASVLGTLPWRDTLGLSLGNSTFRGIASLRSARVQYGHRFVPAAQLLAFVGWTERFESEVSVGLSLNYFFGSRAYAFAPRGGLLDPRGATFTLDATAREEGVDSAVARITNGTTVADGRLSAQVSASLTSDERETVSLGWSGPRSTASASLQSSAGQESYIFTANSALVWMDRTLFRSAPLHGGFAVVRLGDGNGGVRVNTARTDEDGDAVVTPLLAYYPNILTVNSADLAYNARLDQFHFKAAPRYRSGVVVRPPVRRVRDALVTVLVRDEQGVTSPLPVGAYATVAGDKELVPVGEDGAIYVEGLADTSILTVYHNLQECSLTLQVPADVPSDSIPELGPYVCESIRP